MSLYLPVPVECVHLISHLHICLFSSIVSDGGISGMVDIQAHHKLATAKAANCCITFITQDFVPNELCATLILYALAALKCSIVRPFAGAILRLHSLVQPVRESLPKAPPLIIN